MEFGPQMMRNRSDNRKARMSAICALTLVCGLVCSAGALQDSPAGASTTQAAAAKKPASIPSKTGGKTHTASRKHSSRKKSARVRGQEKIDPERAQSIQQALIREHYLAGSATGTWNQASEDAMRRYQADNGWQSTVVPDSRALIKLGLGPSKDHLLNPESAMTTVPDPPKSESTPITSHSATATADPVAPVSSAPPVAPPSKTGPQ